MSKEKYEFEKKRNTKKCNVGDMIIAQRNKQFIEKSDANWNKGKGDIRSRPHLIKLPNYETKLKKSLSSEGNHQKKKAVANVFERAGHVPAPEGSRM